MVNETSLKKLKGRPWPIESARIQIKSYCEPTIPWPEYFTLSKRSSMGLSFTNSKSFLHWQMSPPVIAGKISFSTSSSDLGENECFLQGYMENKVPNLAKGYWKKCHRGGFIVGGFCNPTSNMYYFVILCKLSTDWGMRILHENVCLVDHRFEQFFEDLIF